MKQEPSQDRLSFLGRTLPAAFESRSVTVAPGGVLGYIEAEWRDALVVVEQGRIEVETFSGRRRRFSRGDVLCLIGLSIVALHNHGEDPVLLIAVWRRRPHRGGMF
jgi:quercetin dioxygenase-like cupin family protein